MFSLTIVFGPSPVPWVLLFKDEAKARSVLTADAADPSEFFDCVDDFGQQVHLRSSSIHGVMLEDMEQSKLAHIEQGLHRARTQAKAQTLASADPTLRAAQAMGGAPMLQPGFGNGAFRGQ